MTPDSFRWVKSSYSNNGGQCIEWAPEHALDTGKFMIRDSKKPNGPHLALTAGAWSGLVGFAKTHG
ncbi:DUF397 domain-containing protein [Streptomyces sp. NPDC093097]|uniref:DUF397 domain-containing protein n=1 Tax=Streptomyces sp. NPDC093097 TaxID=3366027 RepID=UPI00382E8F5B